MLEGAGKCNNAPPTHPKANYIESMYIQLFCVTATSIVLEGVDMPDWVQVDWQNRSSYHLRPDYVLDLAQSYSDNDSEENWDAEPLAQPVIGRVYLL